MPLTKFQRKVAKLLSSQRSPDSHLAGGAALHFAPNSIRFSNDLDLFHDSVERVAEAFNSDRMLLEKNGYEVRVDMNQSGFIRAVITLKNESTKIEWVHDSAWRFMPAIHDPETGYQLHPIDLAINKTLALAGRDEARDFIDILYINKEILPLGALVWAAVGKDPGFTPFSLLELLKRRGKYRPEDFERLMLTEPADLHVLKSEWLSAIDLTERSIRARPLAEAGCLYYSQVENTFVAIPLEAGPLPKGTSLHYGCKGGVLPIIAN